jgi:hypothetical protein
MAGGKRPGGLTALAVLNFVFGGISAILLLFAFGLIAITKAAIEKATEAGATATYTGPSLTMVYVSLLLSTITTILLIVSGVGYIGIKKFLGRTLGNLYAVISIGASIFQIVLMKASIGFTVVFMIYPLLTLILLNTTFKEDFVN